MNTIIASMGEGGSVRAIIVGNWAAFSIGHVTESIGAIVLTKEGAPYTPNKLGWVRWTDREGVEREDEEQNYTITARTPSGFDGIVLTPSRFFPVESIEPLATVKTGDVVIINGRVSGRVSIATVTRGTPDARWTIECSYQPESGDSGSLVTHDGRVVGLVSSSSNGGCLVSVPPILQDTNVLPPSVPDVVPEQIAVPTNPTSPYTPPAGSSPEFRSGVIWERNRAFAAAQKRLVSEFNEAISAI